MKHKHLQMQTLDRHIADIHICERPANGWITAIRKALGMSVNQSAKRIGITQQSLTRLEANERNDSITLKSLRRTAEALDCQLVYALVPKDGLQDIIRKQAHLKAREIVSAVDHTMQLEAQGVDNLQQKIKEIADELAQNPNSKLWN